MQTQLDLPTRASPEAVPWQLVTRPVLRAVADAREILHKDHKTSRPLSADYEYIGLIGEWGFARMFDLNMDLSVRPDGDRGVDFVVESGTVDVKTCSMRPRWLLVEKGKVLADLYVLAKYNANVDDVSLLGWARSERVLEKPPVRKPGEVINHMVPVGELENMIDFPI